MAHHNLADETMSESIEMYLLRMALLQEEGQPVPVPQLAQELSISPVSAHEMCRKLTDRGLVEYEPYKGVRLTSQGDTLAQRVLHCRRLWEVFFVEKLGIDPREADEMACRFEHVTPDELADRLARFLDINGMSVRPPVRPLTSLAAGELGKVAEMTVAEVTVDKATADKAAGEFLQQQGIVPGAVIEVLAVGTNGSLLLDVAGRRVSLSARLAAAIGLVPELEEDKHQ